MLLIIILLILLFLRDRAAPNLQALQEEIPIEIVNEPPPLILPARIVDEEPPRAASSTTKYLPLAVSLAMP